MITLTKAWAPRPLVVVAAGLLLLLASSAIALSSELKPKPLSAISVVDAQGRVVGNAIGLNGNRPIVALRVGTVPVIVDVSTMELGPSGNGFGVDIHFETTDCTGQAFIFDMGDPSDVLPRLGWAWQSVYQPSGPGRVVLVRSYLNSGDLTCVTAAEAGHPNGFESMDQPANLLIDFATEFTPPFGVRLIGTD